MFDIAVAVDRNLGIGMLDGRIPWDCPDDLKRFKVLTSYGVVEKPDSKLVNTVKSGSCMNAVIMGRKTFESLPAGALKNRINIVISNTASSFPGAAAARCLDEALDIAEELNAVRKFVIGGAMLYDEAMSPAFRDQIENFHITRIDGVFGCEVKLALDPRDIPTLGIESNNNGGMTKCGSLVWYQRYVRH